VEIERDSQRPYGTRWGLREVSSPAEIESRTKPGKDRRPSRVLFTAGNGPPRIILSCENTPSAGQCKKRNGKRDLTKLGEKDLIFHLPAIAHEGFNSKVEVPGRRTRQGGGARRSKRMIRTGSRRGGRKKRPIS